MTNPRPFGGPPGAAIVPTVIAEPEPTPSVSRNYASAPDEKTMALVDGDFVAVALAELRAKEAEKTLVPPEESDGPTTLDLGGMPQHRTTLDVGHQPTARAMDAVAPPRPTPPPSTPPPSSPYPTTYPSAPLSPYLSPSTPPPPSPYTAHMMPSHTPQAHAAQPPPADQPTYRVTGGFDPAQVHGSQPFPSGELLVPPHGTPPGTMQSHDSLPAHLIGFSQPSYPQHQQQAWPDWTGGVAHARRTLPPWVLTVVLLGGIAIITGIIIAIARAAG
jgi:hypothetical protein